MKASPRWLILGALIAFGAAGYYAWQRSKDGQLPEGIASGNGRIEAVEIDVSTKAAGRIKEILVGEGDFVKAGQVLARMDTAQLGVQRRQVIHAVTQHIVEPGTLREPRCEEEPVAKT